MLDQWKEKIDFYYKCFKIEELLVYKDILYILDVFMQQYTQLEDMEKKLYGTSSSAGSKEQIISMVYRTTMIKLKPEYELYDAILGKENRDANKNYKEDIIKDIQKQMILENTDFQKIKEYITNKYPKENIFARGLLSSLTIRDNFPFIMGIFAITSSFKTLLSKHTVFNVLLLY